MGLHHSLRLGAALVAALLLCGVLGVPSALFQSADLPRAASTLELRHRLGPLGADRTLRIALPLSYRHEAALRRLIAAGHTISARQFARGFLPPAQAVRAGIRQLQQDGLRASWDTGSTMIAAAGPVSAVETALGVSIDRFKGRGPKSFYAPIAPPRLRGALHGLVSTVTGLSDEAHLHPLAQPVAAASSNGCGSSAGGYNPEPDPVGIQLRAAASRAG